MPVTGIGDSGMSVKFLGACIVQNRTVAGETGQAITIEKKRGNAKRCPMPIRATYFQGKKQCVTLHPWDALLYPAELPLPEQRAGFEPATRRNTHLRHLEYHS